MSSNSTKLAIHGAPPTFPSGPPTWPQTSPAISTALNQALQEATWGQYESLHGARLIENLKAQFEVEHAITCSSGTIAVELALRGAGVKAGDEVIMAAYDFPGNFRAVEAIGAQPVLIDVVKNGWTIELGQVEEATSERTKALLLSHLHGQVVDMPHAIEVSQKNSLVLVEDACQVAGGSIAGKPLGGLGDVGALSFGGSKLLSAGRGGAILSNDESIIQRARIFASRGNDAFPLSELQAAVLPPQLDQLAKLTKSRNEGAQQLVKELKNDFGVAEWQWSNDTNRAFYKLPLWVEPKIREAFIEIAKAEGIAIGEGFRGFAKRSTRRCRKPVPLNNAELAASSTVLIAHPILLEPAKEISKLAAVLCEIQSFLTGEAAQP